MVTAFVLSPPCYLAARFHVKQETGWWNAGFSMFQSCQSNGTNCYKLSHTLLSHLEVIVGVHYSFQGLGPWTQTTELELYPRIYQSCHEEAQ
jgi:hypothetical protein